MDSRGTNVITLKPHCDLEVSAKNVVNKNISQKAETPTVVLTLQSDKKLDYYKRYSNGTSFVNGNCDTKNRVDSMILQHGDFFILHPDDERVFSRKIRTKGNRFKAKHEEMKSQFQHGVTCSICIDCCGNVIVVYLSHKHLFKANGITYIANIYSTYHNIYNIYNSKLHII